MLGASGSNRCPNVGERVSRCMVGGGGITYTYIYPRPFSLPLFPPFHLPPLSNLHEFPFAIKPSKGVCEESSLQKGFRWGMGHTNTARHPINPNRRLDLNTPKPLINFVSPCNSRAVSGNNSPGDMTRYYNDEPSL